MFPHLVAGPIVRAKDFLTKAGLSFTGMSPDRKFVEIIEIHEDHHHHHVDDDDYVDDEMSAAARRVRASSGAGPAIPPVQGFGYDVRAAWRRTSAARSPPSMR